MKYFEKVPAVLLLQDGTVFHGESCGKIGTTTGELCFNTGMTGYQEIFTDPSYFKQILIMTNAHIGNYGARDEDEESQDVKIAGLVTKNFTNLFSREMANSSIQDYALDEQLVGISGVDTRALVRYIREKGAMNGVISSETTDIVKLKAILDETPSMEGMELSSQVCCKKAYFYGSEDAQYKLAVLDCGTKKNILRNFAQRDCYMKVFPAQTPFSEIEEWGADGYFVSNGPGDPAAMDYAIQTAQSMINSKKPVFGICLGHQIIALAMGLKTYKMHHGHRGANHPVKNLVTGLGEITTQNHGFGVSDDSLQSNKLVDPTHINLNDGTIEGIKVKDKPAFSVQYHPEAAPGPHDSRYLFDNFVAEIAKGRS